MKQKTVLGLGNILHRDEGVGVHALRELQAKLENNSPYQLIDGGVLGLSLLPFVEESSHLLILDAIDANRMPGSVIELGLDQISLFTKSKLSPHQMTFHEVLALAKVRQNLPTHLRVIGVQPADMMAGTQLSPVVNAGLSEIVARAESILARWNDD